MENDYADLDRPTQLGMLASFEQAPVGILHLDLDGFLIRANERMCKLLDFSEAELVGKHFTRRMVSDDAARIQADLPRMLAEPGTVNNYEVRLIRQGGTLNWVQVTAYCIVDGAGAPACLVWWVSDIEQRRQLKDMLQLSNRALAASSNGVLISDATQPSFPIMYANPAFCRMTGYELIDVMGRNSRFLQNDDRDQPAIATVRAAIASHREVHVVLRNYRKDGTLFWNDLYISPVPDEKGEVTHYIGILTDITELKQHEEKLAFAASHDELTGLPNRSLFNDRLQQAIRHAARRADAVAVLTVGIDNFTFVNESLGHLAGDRLLMGVANRLLACVRKQDTVSRHGGAEFVLILGEVGNSNDVTLICDHVFETLAHAFSIAGQMVHAACSIGITLYPQDGADAATLLRFADMALSRAREQGGSKYQFFSSEMNQRTGERIRMEAALRLALVQDELQLLYQPLADLQDGSVCALEALVRWQHPELGLVSAQRFIPIAEEAGLIGAIGDWILRRACRDLRAWRAAGARPVTLALNLSPKQFRDRQLPERLAATLAEFELGPDMLALEVTETALMQDPHSSAATLARLKEMGIRLTLDDFGTGYSSLSNMRRFPFDLVKIDGELVRNLQTDSDNAALAKTIISMAHHLGIKVLGEGVESEAQCDFLRRNMCDQVQGFFFAQPMPEDQVLAMLREGRSLPPHLLRIQQRKRSLLLVDDEQNIVSALKRLLRRDDYVIHTANSGQEGLDVLARHQVDVIVSDQRMPGMIGADFLRKAKDLYPDTIRIMLSGYTELQSVTDAVNEGAIYKFLTKPWEDELLRGHIAEAFRLKEIANDNERLNLELRTANHELASANRKMEQLLREKQQQITLDEISLSVARELLQFLPLPVIGLDDSGMIAFVNAAGEDLFRKSGSLLGNEAAMVLPELFPDGEILQGGASHATTIEGLRYDVVVHPMGSNSESRGNLITLKLSAEDAA